MISGLGVVVHKALQLGSLMVPAVEGKVQPQCSPSLLAAICLVTESIAGLAELAVPILRLLQTMRTED